MCTIPTSEELSTLVTPLSSSTQLEHGQWRVSFILENSTCLMEVSVTEQILRKFPEILEGLSIGQTVCTRLFFSAHAQEPRYKATLVVDSMQLVMSAK